MQLCRVLPTPFLPLRPAVCDLPATHATNRSSPKGTWVERRVPHRPQALSFSIILMTGVIFTFILSLHPSDRVHGAAGRDYPRERVAKTGSARSSPGETGRVGCVPTALPVAPFRSPLRPRVPSHQCPHLQPLPNCRSLKTLFACQSCLEKHLPNSFKGTNFPFQIVLWLSGQRAVGIEKT